MKVTRVQRVSDMHVQARVRVSLRIRAYPKHRSSGSAQWSRRRLRSTSLSSGSPFGSLCRSRSWRWSGCSPDCPSERVRPGQPWLPVCHKTVRITSPSEQQPRLAVSTLSPLLSLPLSASFFFWSIPGCLSLIRPIAPVKQWRGPSIKTSLSDSRSVICLRCTFQIRSSARLSPPRHISTEYRKESTSTYGYFAVDVTAQRHHPMTEQLHIPAVPGSRPERTYATGRGQMCTCFQCLDGPHMCE